MRGLLLVWSGDTPAFEVIEPIDGKWALGRDRAALVLLPTVGVAPGEAVSLRRDRAAVGVAPGESVAADRPTAQPTDPTATLARATQHATRPARAGARSRTNTDDETARHGGDLALYSKGVPCRMHALWIHFPVEQVTIVHLATARAAELNSSNAVPKYTQFYKEIWG